MAVIKKQRSQTRYYQAIGRRREASANVRLYPLGKGTVTVDAHTLKKGDIIVNGKPIEQYFPGIVNSVEYLAPFRIADALHVFAVSIKVKGGGAHGQLGAVVHGIARALEKVDRERYRPLLKSHKLLTRDPRKKERRKAGLAQKARARKQSPKR